MDPKLSNPSTWLSLAFWGDILQRSVTWAVEALPKVLLVLLLAWALLRLLKLACRKLAERAATHAQSESAAAAREQEKRADTLIAIVQKAGGVAIWILVGMLLLVQIGVNVAPLIAGAGILGLAIGFGAQELVRDVISGFFILLENHVRNGDVAIINGTGGLVESMGLRTITLRDLSGVVHVFQNGKINSLSNMTKDWSAMVFEIGVAYKEDTDQVVEVMRRVSEELREDPKLGQVILEPMEIFGIESFGDSAVVIKARLKTKPIEQWTVGREYRRRLKKAFDARRIEIPFPHQTLYFGEASEPFQVRVQDGNGAPKRASKSPEGLEQRRADSRS